MHIWLRIIHWHSWLSLDTLLIKVSFWVGTQKGSSKRIFSSVASLCLRISGVGTGLSLRTNLLSPTVPTTAGICKWSITKTRLNNIDPLKPNFDIVKLGFTGVYIIFIILLKHRLWVDLTRTHNLCFEQKNMKNMRIFIWKFSYFGCKIFNIFE